MREATNKILEMIEEGILDRDTVIMAALKYMSEDEVADMARANEFFDDEDEYEDDGQPSEYEEWQDFYGGDDAFETCNFMEDY